MFCFRAHSGHRGAFFIEMPFGENRTKLVMRATQHRGEVYSDLMASRLKPDKQQSGKVLTEEAMLWKIE